MQNFGFIESKLDGNEIIFDKKLLQGTKPIPDEYDYTKMVSCLKKPKDQGSTSKCVPYSLSYAIEAAYQHYTSIDNPERQKIKFQT